MWGKIKGIEYYKWFVSVIYSVLKADEDKRNENIFEASLFRCDIYQPPGTSRNNV